jgi:hypothetical protein
MFGGPKLKLDKDVLEKATRYASEKGYSSVEEFITHLIEKEISGDESGEDEAAVREKLQGLGYIS